MMLNINKKRLTFLLKKENCTWQTMQVSEKLSGIQTGA
jgi:hypothetical protein